uniref:Uncharacterized protein n=1 Tax=viral metagenome TaxID=1070528 RepID=A0A6C0CBB6_9ZZZZ
MRLPETIGRLSNLRRLLLCNNRIIKLPEEIGELVNLQFLCLDFNKIAVLPETIDQLINCKITKNRQNLSIFNKNSFNILKIGIVFILFYKILCHFKQNPLSLLCSKTYKHGF